MDRKAAIHSLLGVIAFEVLEFIKQAEPSFTDRWVPATYIKDELELNLLCYPKSGKTQQEQGWLFSTLARMLEDREVLDYRKKGGHAFYRTK